MPFCKIFVYKSQAELFCEVRDILARSRSEAAVCAAVYPGGTPRSAI